MAIVMGLLAAAIAAAGPAGSTPARAQVLPTTFEAGHFFAVPETVQGQHLRLVVDTGGGGGGGMYWIAADAARRLGLKTHTCTVGNVQLTVAPVPPFRTGHGLPSPLPGPCGTVMQVYPKGEPGDDGQLGAGYLPGRVWTFDYPARRLSLEATSWRPDPAAHATALGFPRNAQGQRQSGFARITIRVDGQPLDLLLDTGATAHPTAESQRISGTSTANGYGVTSYITTGVLERWHRAHPDWRVVTDGDDLLGPKHTMRLIEVPKLEIAGWTAGPVWFTERPDRNFHEVMSSYMDKQVEGAVGANVFDHFAMTIDYPHATAYFRCVRGCQAVATPPPAP